MPSVYVQNISIPLSDAKPSDSGVISAQATYSFPTNVIAAGASVASYSVSFGNTDHHLRTVGASVQVQTQNNSPTVTITGTLQLIDNSSNELNPSSCSLIASVIAWAQ
ncbi:hypothetical protein LGM46_29810 [Burkholderia arboris]|uniref:hypothetical protein n=1 Tax=Burkholderia arboris TaxID=488730 RepID=UPI001CF2969C|nr:hypothetical protein [Burkholderia arboris]MCA8037168.1 hypothetical protein [Burkholderia arboris]